MARVVCGTKTVRVEPKFPDFVVQYGTKIGSTACPAGVTLFGSIVESMPIWNPNNSMVGVFQFLWITFTYALNALYFIMLNWEFCTLQNVLLTI